MSQINNISINFIVSTSRTGSTLLSSMLNMHSNVLSISEEPFAYNIYPKYKNISVWTDSIVEQYCYDFYLFSEANMQFQFGKKNELKERLKQHQANLTIHLAITLTYLSFFPDKDKSQITTIVDKELKFHHVISDVATFYPKSKFIILLRDPRDTVLINIKKKEKEKTNANLIEIAKTWNYVYQVLSDKIALLDKSRSIKIKYEDLVENPEGTLKKISHFLNIKYDSNMLNYNEEILKTIEQASPIVKNHIVTTHEGLIQKVNTNKIGIWKKEMSKKQSDIIWSICEQTAVKNGYEKDTSDIISYLNIINIYHLMRFYISNMFIPKIYFSAPFIIKYIIKKLKYHKTVYQKMTG